MAFKVQTERELAFIVIFESLFHKEDGPDDLFGDILEGADPDGIYSNVLSGIRDGDLDYARAALAGVIANDEKIRGIITSHAKGWKYDRISRVSLAVLKLAIWEILFSDAVHPGTAINEAVELAKIYDDDKAPAFVNGILGSVVREDLPGGSDASSDEKQ